MNYPTSAILDTDALMIALAHQRDRLPVELQQKLIEAGQQFIEDPTVGAQIIRDLIRSYPPLETEYFSAIKKWVGEYGSQERAKNLTATFQTNQGFGFIFSHDILPNHDWVNATQALTKRRSDSTSPFWENFDRTAIMGAGGAFLGSALAQLLGGGILHLIGALIGAIVGIAYGLSLLNPTQRRRS